MNDDRKEPRDKRSAAARETGQPPRNRPNTIIDVSRLAGVSPAAVSRAFAKEASISPEKRQAVIEAARKLNYRPNLLARSLITGRSLIIGIVLHHLDNHFYPGILEQLSIALSAHGYRLLLFFIDPAKGDFDPIIEDLLRFRVEAVIMGSVILSDRSAEACHTAGVAALLLNHKTDSNRVSSVTGNNWQASAEIAAFLVAGGHRRLAVVAGRGDTSASRDREDGFVSHLREIGFRPPQRVVGNYSPETTQAAARKMLSARNRPDAVFCCNDQMAYAFIGVARHEFGLTIGRDISVVGFDDAPISSWPDFDLTTYSQPVKDIVANAVGTLLTILDDPDRRVVRATHEGKLIVRSSARIPPEGIIEVNGERTWRRRCAI